MQCHPSLHTVPCNREATHPSGLRLWAFGVPALFFTLCCCWGVMRMEVQLRLRVLKKALRERTWSKEPLRVSDRVVCLISEPGRFNEGDVGIIVGMTDIGQTLMRLDRQAAAEPDKPIAQFCLRRLDINDQRQVHNGRLQKRVGGERPSELEPLLA